MALHCSSCESSTYCCYNRNAAAPRPHVSREKFSKFSGAIIIIVRSGEERGNGGQGFYCPFPLLGTSRKWQMALEEGAPLSSSRLRHKSKISPWPSFVRYCKQYQSTLKYHPSSGTWHGVPTTAILEQDSRSAAPKLNCCQLKDWKANTSQLQVLVSGARFTRNILIPVSANS